MDKFQGMGKTFGQIIEYIYIWIAVVLIFVVIFILQITKYIHDKRITRTEKMKKTGLF